jgi:hypothetical protein
MRSTFIGWLLLLLVSAFWPGQAAAMADEVELYQLIQAGTTEYLGPQADSEAAVTTCAAPRLEAQSSPPLGHVMADLAGDKLDCAQLVAAPCHAVCLPQATPLLPIRILVSHWPEALQRPPCALSA